MQQKDQQFQDLFSEFPTSTKEEWVAQVVKDLKGADWTEALVWNANDGLQIQPFFRKEDYPLSFANSSQFLPGWEIRQEFYVSDVDSTNLKIKKALTGGLQSVCLYLPNELTKSQVELLFDDVYIEMITIHWSGEGAEASFRAYLEIGADRGLAKDSLMGSFWNENFPALHAEFGKDYPCIDFLTASIDHKLISTLNPIEQIALLCAIGLENYEKMDSADPNGIMFYTEIGKSYFSEIAKCRSLRQVWGNIVEAMGIGAKPEKIAMQATNALHLRDLEDPYKNLLQSTTMAISAVLGGCCSISLLAMDDKDEERGYDSDFFQRIQNNIQLLLKHESHLDEVADPLAGSYYLEHLCSEYTQQAWALFQEIAKEGTENWIANKTISHEA